MAGQKALCCERGSFCDDSRPEYWQGREIPLPVVFLLILSGFSRAFVDFLQRLGAEHQRHMEISDAF